MASVSGILNGRLTPVQKELEERVRTIALCVVAFSCVSYGLYVLRGILVPLVLAVALKYLLQPLIDLLSVRPLPCCAIMLCQERSPVSLPRRSRVGAALRCLCTSINKVRLPHGLAVCVALGFAFGVLALLGVIIAESIHVFTGKADVYSKRVESLALSGLSFVNTMQMQFRVIQGNATTTNGSAADAAEELTARVNEFVHKLPISALVLQTLTALLELVSNLALVLLFAVYLLLSPPTRKSPQHTPLTPDVNVEADQQIHAYIRGKCLMSLLVSVFTGVTLYALEVDLWLVFGLLAFWLNFIPNIGTVLAVMLPMPVVILDPTFSAFGIMLALLLPLGAHAFAGNVLEPFLFGHTLKLHPVTILISLMVWGSTWGVTGMLMAVPMTAVLRIRLAHIAHPLPQYLASVLVGDTDSVALPLTPRKPADAALPLAEVLEDGMQESISAANAPLCRNDAAASSAGPNSTEMQVTRHQHTT
uniref:AI-2E family transporter n=1 Tax=Haptolina brevifila TaxID=156173 RepID=A0A7S2NN93_9EUKA